MSLLSWIYGKGIAGAISSDLIIKYLGIKSQHPAEGDSEILVRLWNFWLTLNAEKIEIEDGEDKNIRLHIIKEKNEKKTGIDSLIALKNLLGLYQDILYIETEITPADGRIWENAMEVFVKTAQKYGLDLSNEFEMRRRLIRR